MTTNKEIMEYMFNKIKSMGFTPYNITHPDGYFLMEGKPYSVVHFQIKEVWKSWKFGMWLNEDYLNEEYRKEYEEKFPDSKMEWNVIKLFCQHKHCIDKFKPSASSLLVEYDYEEWENRDKWKNTFYQLEDMLKMIKRHPLMCYDGFCGEYVGYKETSFLKDYLTYECYLKKKEIIKQLNRIIYLPYTYVKLFFADHSKCIKKITVHNFEKENPGWSTNHLYEVKVEFTDDSTEEEQIKWVNRWFHKDKYGTYDTYDNVIEIEYYYLTHRIGFSE